MNREKLSEILFENIKMVEPYPSSVAKIDKQLTMTAFFPGGKGIWHVAPSNKLPTIMVLGHDFSTENKFRKMLAGTATDLDSATWRNMIKLFNEAGIELDDCFFTNAFMGLRKTTSMVGEFPAFKDEGFKRRCVSYLHFQIETLQPRIIIALGKYAAEILASMSDDLDIWGKWAALRVSNVGYVEDVKINGHTCQCVALEHPSMRNSNVKRRHFENHRGNEAEIEMLKRAINK